MVALLPACSQLEVSPDKVKDDDKERGILIDTTKD